METQRPRRSVLYVPGDKARALEKARSLPVDAIILDLEDAVAPDHKARAREAVVAAIRAGGYGRRELIVRINAADTDWGKEDLAALALCSPDAVLVPKVESRDDLVPVEAALGDQPLWIMAETPRGILNLDAILGQLPGVAVVVMGTADLAKATRVPARQDREGLAHARAQCVLVARAHERDVLDGVHTQLDDIDGLVKACKEGRQLGFDGKTLIHPEQIDAANEHFGVTDLDAAEAQAIVDAWNQAGSKNGPGVITVAGRLVERLHVEQAQRLLDLRSQTELNK